MISLHEVDLNLPPVIQALEHHQNVTRAGEALNMSQSALSDALAQLPISAEATEEFVGMALFVPAFEGERKRSIKPAMWVLAAGTL